MLISKKFNWRIILRDTGLELTFYAAVSSLVFLMYRQWDIDWVPIPATPVALMSTALSIFLGFRGNSAYDRWWEARRLWGSLVNSSRAFGRHVLTFMDGPEEEILPFQRMLIYRHIAFVNALRLTLRRQTNWNELKPVLARDDYTRIQQADNVPNLLTLWQGKSLSSGRGLGYFSELRYMQTDLLLIEFTAIQGGCERIKNTPFPRQYHFFPSLFIRLHAVLIPMALVAEVGWIVIPLSTVVSFVFLSINLISQSLEDPFEGRLNDVPLTALCRTIEINLREQLGEADLPDKVEAVNGFLL